MFQPNFLLYMDCMEDMVCLKAKFPQLSKNSSICTKYTKRYKKEEAKASYSEYICTLPNKCGQHVNHFKRWFCGKSSSRKINTANINLCNFFLFQAYFYIFLVKLWSIKVSLIAYSCCCCVIFCKMMQILIGTTFILVICCLCTAQNLISLLLTKKLHIRYDIQIR